MRSFRKIAVSLEDDNEGVVAGVDANDNVRDGDLESQIAEVDAGATEIGEIEAAVEEGVEEIDNLENVAEVVEGTLGEDGEGEGASAPTAELAEIAVERARFKLGLPARRAMPATETFGSRSSRRAATNIGLENIWETVKTAWKKVVEMAKHLYTKVVDFLKSVFTSVGRLKARAKSLKEKVSNTMGVIDSEKQIKNDSIANTFAIDGKFGKEDVFTILGNHVAAGAEYVKVASESDKVFKQTFETVKKEATEIGSAIEKAGSSNLGSKFYKEISDLINAVVGSGGVELSATVKKNLGIPDTELEKGRMTPVLAGQMHGVTLKLKYSTGDDAVCVYRAEFVSGADKAEELKDQTLETLDKNSMFKIITEVEKLATSLEKESKATSRNAEKVKQLEQLSGIVESAASKFASGSSDDAKKKDSAKRFTSTMSETRKVLVALLQSDAKVDVNINRLGVKAAGKALDYVAESINCYKKAA